MKKRGRFAAFLILTLLATAITVFTTSSAESKKAGKAEQNTKTASIADQLFVPQSGSVPSTQEGQEGKSQEGANSSAAQQERPAMVLTMQNAPRLPQCRSLIKQELLDLVNAAAEDPGVTFERNRRAHPHMIMIPPPLDCASQLWKSARRGGVEEAAVDPEAISSRQYPIESVFDVTGLSALVGSNIDPSNGVEGYQGETSIAIDPNNPLHIVAHSNTFFKDTNPQCQSPTGGTANTYGTMALFGSSDGGATWTYNCAPWPAAVTGGVASATFWFGSDPALAWDNQGRAYATYMLISQSNAGASGASIVTARSSDNGLTWQSLGTVTSGITSTTIGNDKEMMAIDNTSGQAFSHPGRIYVIWDAANAEKIAYSDNGSTWTTVNFASNTGAIGGNVVVGADGTVYAIWNRYNVETIVFSKSTDGGATWTAPAVIATLALQSFGTNNLPPAQDQRGVNGFGAIDIDRNPNSAYFGTLYVSFPDFPTGTTSGTDINTYVIRSTNGGTSWSTRVKVNDDNFTATQFFPWLAVDQSDGTVNVSWIDTRLDPLNRKTQAVYARSSDGGASFEANILVTDGGVNWRNNANYSDENSTDNPTYNGNQYGDYTGIAAFNRQVHPLWTDSRSFFPTADTQSPTRREDNGTATIINCSAPAAISAPSVNSSTAPSVALSWNAPAGWGTNATNGTYSVYRNTTPSFPSGAALASNLTATNFVDTTGVNGTTYYYFVRGKNNCPGTALTAMSTDSSASASVVFGSAGTATGILQGTVTSGGLPLSNVIVNAGAFSATTNGSGVYQFPAINAGTYTVSTSPAGYSPASVSGVVVTDGGTTVQNLSLTATSASSCFTDTSFGDFSTGSGTGVELASSPGDVKLAGLGSEAADQVSTPASLFIANTPTSTTWTGQTFRAGATGNLTKISLGLGLNSGTTGTVTVEIRNLNGTNPGTTVLASTTLGPVTNVGNVSIYSATFTTPAAVVSGTSYSVVVKGGTGSVFTVRGNTSSLANGQIFTTTTSGGTWTAVTADLYFTEYVTPTGLQTSGNFVSAVKDSGAVTGTTPNWSTISWNNAVVPAGATLKFQVAGSNSASGPFNFVGPDGTAATFFTTSGASISQFNGQRYLKYKALFTGTGTNTPTLNDVTVCFNNVAPVSTSLTAPPVTGTYGGTVNLSATLTDGTNPISGKSIAFKLFGVSKGSAVTNGSGVATVSNVSLSGINAGSYVAVIELSFAGDSGYQSSGAAADLTVNQASQTITFGALGGKTYGAADFSVSASASSGLAVSFAAAGNCSVTGTTVHITGAGSCTITASQAGNTNYSAAPNVDQSFSIAQASTTTVVTVSNAAYDGNPHGATATVTGAGGLNQSVTVSYSGRNATTYGPSTTAPTAAGDYTASANYAGDSNYTSSSDSKDYSITKVNQTITFGALSDKVYGDADFTVSASSSSGLAVSFSASGACTVTGDLVHITGVGSCTITASQGGDANYNAASSVDQSFNIGKGTATVALSNLSYTYDGTPRSATATTTPNGLSVSITYDGSATAPTNAGSYSVVATITDANYQGSASDTLVISKATASISVTGYTGVYDGNSHGATGTATGVQSEDLSGLLHLGSSYMNVPGGTANWTFDGGNNYNSANGSVEIAISKATAVITWSNPADIVYGTALGGTQLNATASTAGSFLYTPASGTVLPAGNNQNLHVDFTPTDTVNYQGASKDVSINVLAPSLSITKVAQTTDPTELGKIFPYVITVTNSGSASATSVVVTDALASSLTYNTVITSQGSCTFTAGNNTVTCQLGSIAANTSASITLKVKPRQEGAISNTASYTSTSAGVNAGNATTQINVIKTADLKVTKVDSADPIYVGEQTTYTMTVTNLGPVNTSTGTTLTDSLPSGMVFVSATTSHGTLVTPPVDSGGIVTANLGTLGVNVTATVTVTVKATAAGTLVNSATAAANETDPNAANNTANQATTVNTPPPPPTLLKVLLSNQSPVGGCTPFPTGQAYLTAAAPAGGVTVNLSSTNAGATVPASVFIPAGQTKSAAFTVTTVVVSKRQDGNIVATLPGSNTVTRNLQVYAGTCPQ